MEQKNLIKPQSINHLPDFTPVISLTNNFSSFLLKMRQKKWDSWEAFLLNFQGETLALRQGAEDLLVLTHLQEYWRQNEVIPYPHQIETVKRVISQMHGRAILADEVGLGKTIEAGMILKEYLLRGLVKKFLILTPAALCRQWEVELREKFEIPVILARTDYDWSYDAVLASIDTAKKGIHRERIQEQYYDLIIVDEAHKLKSSTTQNWQFVNQIKKKYFLLLTATPLQNDLKELFNLITMLRPGQLGNYRSFKKKYMLDKRTPQNSAELKQLLGEVIIRNKHGANMGFTKRHVHNIPVVLSPIEQQLYDQVTSFIRDTFFQGSTGIGALPLLMLQREICSSTFAAVLTLFRLAQKIDEDQITDPERAANLFRLAQQVKDNSKMKIVTELVTKNPEKMIIFTEFLATQSYIRTRLEQAGIASLAFDGSLSASKKEFTKYQFKTDPRYQVLVCTESGGEGINLQFCNTMINYDLPWNPMRLEQRIGRIHRLGQLRDVYIYNLSTCNTIEEHLLKLLSEKIQMFEMVIGESERVIGKLCSGKSFEARILELVISSNSHQELQQGFQRLGQEIDQLLALDNPTWEEIL